MVVPHPRFVLFLLVFVLVAAAASLRLETAATVILGFDVAAAAFILASLPLWWADSLDAIRARSARDDGGRVLLPLVSAMILAVLLLALGRIVGGRDQLGLPDLGLVVATLAMAWIFSNLVLAFHYAHVFYDQTEAGDSGGLRFPGTELPLFADFVYFAFVVGMTSQVSDVAIVSRHMRRIAVVHGLFAFFFNLGVLALTINVLSGVL